MKRHEFHWRLMCLFIENYDHKNLIQIYAVIPDTCNYLWREQPFYSVSISLQSKYYC